jgi:hypothetical protein
MTLQEHLDRFFAGDYSPRVVERERGFYGARGYVAWTSCKEGPVRPDHAAALADLRDITEG